MLADFHDFNELRWIGIEIDHVAGFFRGLRAGIHGDPDIGLSQRRRVVRAVSGHGDEFALRLFAPDEIHFFLGSCLRQKIVDSCFAGNSRGRKRIVAGDHDGPDSHSAQLIEAIAHAALHDVFEINHAKGAAIFGDHQRRSARTRDLLNHGLGFFRHHGVMLLQIFCDGIDRAFADLTSVKVNT